MNNQPRCQEKTDSTFKKPDVYHQKAAMRMLEICVKNASPPNKWAAKRSQGGV
jgi:hypothetical protein